MEQIKMPCAAWVSLEMRLPTGESQAQRATQLGATITLCESARNRTDDETTNNRRESYVREACRSFRLANNYNTHTNTHDGQAARIHRPRLCCTHTQAATVHNRSRAITHQAQRGYLVRKAERVRCVGEEGKKQEAAAQNRARRKRATRPHGRHPTQSSSALVIALP